MERLRKGGKMKNNPVFRVAAKILFAPIILFGLYVQFHGDFGLVVGFRQAS